MGGGASIQSEVAAVSQGEGIVTLKKLPSAIDDSVYVQEKFPFIIDPTEMASKFLKYQIGAFVNSDDPLMMDINKLNRSLVGAFVNGRTMTIHFPTLEGYDWNKLFSPEMFPVEVVNRQAFFKEEVWRKTLKPADTAENDVTLNQEFVFIIVSTADYVPPELKEFMSVIKVVEKTENNDSTSNSSGGGDDVMDQVASLFGANEIIRNSTQLVEAAFDGDREEMKNWIDKGYHLESFDGRKHTALSEAACQGHLHIVEWLLKEGVDPNSASDTNRTPLWRASFNGHYDVCKVLLEAGSDPDARDKISHESTFDIAKTDEIRQLIGSWDRSRTAQSMEARRRVMLAKIEERIKTSAEREQFARAKIRAELVAKAEAGDAEGVKQMLLMIADEAAKSNQRPRATAEVRNDTGQSLLSIAAQFDHEELAEMLLTHWKKCDADRWDLAEGELSVEATVFKTNVNSRDLKGWNCACIAVFQESKKVLALLLEAGADPNMRSSYNKNAWDLAKDDLDAAEHVIKSRAEIRQVLIDHDKTNTASLIFGNGSATMQAGSTDIYKDLGPEGSPITMQIEMNKGKGKGNSGGVAGAGAGAKKGTGGGKKGGGKKK